MIKIKMYLLFLSIWKPIPNFVGILLLQRFLYVTYTSKAGFGTVDDKIHFISTAPELREKYVHSYFPLIMISYLLTITLLYIVESIDKARLAEDRELLKTYKEENK